MRQRPTNNRRGAATVEAAICLPVLLLLVFGSIQACDTVHLQHVATLAAYEGTLAACKENATATDVKNRAGALLTGMRVQNGTVSIEPNVPDLSTLAPGTKITVTVEAPVEKNLTGPALFTPSDRVRATGVTMR